MINKPGHLSGSRILKYFVEGQITSKSPGNLRDQIHGQERMAAQREEIIFNSNFFPLEDFGPNVAKDFFSCSVGQNIFSGLLRKLDLRERIPVYLAIRIQ